MKKINKTDLIEDLMAEQIEFEFMKEKPFEIGTTEKRWVGFYISVLAIGYLIPLILK